MSERIDDEAEGEISLLPAVRTLWSYRRAMLLGMAAVVTAYVATLLVLYVVMPKEQFASIQFRLTFAGADQDKYPNGTKFSSAEIVATPVLLEVYKKDELQRYLEFTDFKASTFVLQANPELEVLSYEYQAKLSDTRLTPVDRSRIEEEFQKKRESLKSGFYSLNFRKSNRATLMPVTLLNKVLQDTLSVWAQQAADRKGVARYDIAITSKNALKAEFLASEDYIVAVDVLRSMINRTLRTVDEIAKIPGAEAVRMGPDRLALADVRGNLENLLRFKVEALVRDIRTHGLLRNGSRPDAYFADRLLDAQLLQQEAKQRIATMQDALRGYEERSIDGSTASAGDQGMRGITPQLTESFIDRLVQLSTQATDLEYRKALTNKIIDAGLELAEYNRQVDYYASMEKTFQSVRPTSDSAMTKEVTDRTKDLYLALGVNLDQLGAMFETISQENLNPDTTLYAVTAPFVARTASPITLRTGMVYLLMTVFAAAILIPLICLAHYYLHHWISPQNGAGRGGGQVAGA